MLPLFQTLGEDILALWEDIRMFNFAGFNWPVLLWPVLTVLFTILFFLWYRRDMQPRKGTLEWIGEQEKPRLSLAGPRGRMSGRDWLIVCLFTLIYGLMSFWPFGGYSPGENKAPQSFWQATQNEPSATLDLGREVDLDTFMYYTGLWHGEWKLELSSDGAQWREQTYLEKETVKPGMEQGSADLFKWRYARLEETQDQKTRFIRITSQRPPMELGELVLVERDDTGNRKRMNIDGLGETYPQCSGLFDEQDLAPLRPTQNNGAIFDEIYHARTAYEYLRNVYPYETTHPPLGKAIISVGIRIFGMTPFGWRFMGILFGILMVPLMYIFIKNVFSNTAVAACGTALFTFESMHFTQTHLATIDTYGVFFTILMYLFMFRYITSGYETSFARTLPPLILCGLSFGLGAASKWTGFYAAAGIAVMYVFYLVMRGKHQWAKGQKQDYLSFLLLTLGASIFIFVLIPLVIYTLSYIPYVTSQHKPVTLMELSNAMWSNQLSMINYHGLSVLDATHPYESRWWMWMLDIRPILYYSNYPEGMRTTIGAFTNPLLTIGGLVAMGATLMGLFRRKHREALLIVIGYLSNLVPWMLVSRITFAYHYFPSTIFLTLALCYIFNNIWRRRPEHRWRVYLFTGIAMVIFLILYPPMAGLTIPSWYGDFFVKWLPTWPF